MNEDLEPPISYSAADLHDITGRLAVNGVGEIKNVVHSLLEPSQTDAE